MNPPEEEEQCCVIYCVDLLYEHFSLHVSDVKVSIVGLFMLKNVAFGSEQMHAVFISCRTELCMSSRDLATFHRSGLLLQLLFFLFPDQGCHVV